MPNLYPLTRLSYSGGVRAKDDPARMAAYKRLYRERHKPRIVAERAQRYKTAREAVLAVLGGKCGRCGFDDARALQIDHINGGGRRFDKNNSSDAFFRRVTEAVKGGSDKYQLLCANCNWIKRYENGEQTNYLTRRLSAQTATA